VADFGTGPISVTRGSEGSQGLALDLPCTVLQAHTVGARRAA